MWAKNNKQRASEWNKRYRLTPRGKALGMWQGILRRIENKSGNHPTYAKTKLLCSKSEFLNWVIPALEDWQTRHTSLTNVSIDRIKEEKHYSVDNLQLLEKGENSRKKRDNKNVHAPDGLAWCGQCKIYLPMKNFFKCKTHYNGLSGRCKLHRI